MIHIFVSLNCPQADCGLRMVSLFGLVVEERLDSVDMGELETAVSLKHYTDVTSETILVPTYDDFEVTEAVVGENGRCKSHRRRWYTGIVENLIIALH